MNYQQLDKCRTIAVIRSPDILSAHPQEVTYYFLTFPIICPGVKRLLLISLPPFDPLFFLNTWISFGGAGHYGQRKEAWFEFGDDRAARYDYLYGPEELADLAGRTKEPMEKTEEAYVIFNNHPACHAGVAITVKSLRFWLAPKPR